MKKKLILLILLLVTIHNIAFGEQLREKSSVLLIFNNQAHKRYNDKLTEIAEAELNKKVIGIYLSIDPAMYRSTFANRSFEKDSVNSLEQLVSGSKADYFVYTELQPYTSKESYDLIYHRKSMTATMVLRILDLNTHSELFSAKYSLSSNDDTDYFFIGNQSVAQKALKTVLFKIGEAISVKLPL